MSLLLLGCILTLCLDSVIALERNKAYNERYPISTSSENSCKTPSQGFGICISLTRCKSLIQQRNIGLVRRSKCGFEGGVPKVCCASTEDGNIRYGTSFPTKTNREHKAYTPTRNLYSNETEKAERRNLSSSGRRMVFPRASNSEDSCTTPFETSGSCIPLLQCRNLVQKRNLGLVRRSICGFEGKAPKVCCASIEDDDIHFAMSSQTVTNAPLKISETPPDLFSNGTKKTGRQRTPSYFSSDCGHSSATFTRIVGGQESNLGAWPWMAVIYYVRRNGKSAECGGVLVTKKHVITAAHCIVSSRRGITMNPRQLMVRLGDHDIERDDEGADPIDLSVSSIIKYRDFDIRTFQNDIAILVLTSSVEFGKFIAPICLPFNAFNGDDLARRNAFTAGWGTISYGGPASSKLQEVQLRIWDNHRCKEVFKSEVPITDANLCAGDGDKDACRGDSGGPLMLADTDGKFYLSGIVSFGKKCAEPGYPGVYTRISHFLNWIESKIDFTM